MMVNILGLALLAFVIYWFWPRPPQTTAKARAASTGPIRVADGVYEPDTPSIPAGQPAVLRFLRQDPSPCAQYVVFPDLDISQELALGKETPVQLPALAPGRYPFHCQMKMYQGQLLVS